MQSLIGKSPKRRKIQPCKVGKSDILFYWVVKIDILFESGTIFSAFYDVLQQNIAIISIL